MLHTLHKKAQPYAYASVRVLVGLLFFLFGVMKFGYFGASQVASLWSIFWFAGIIEVAVGLALVVGFFVRPMTGIAAIEMLVAFFYAHFPSGWNPVLNDGVAALLFFALFVIFHIHGAGQWSIDASTKKEYL